MADVSHAISDDPSAKAGADARDNVSAPGNRDPARWPPDASRLRINATGRFACTPDWSWDTASAQWRDLDLWVVTGGLGRLDTPLGVFDLARGDAFLLRGGERYIGTTTEDAPLRVIAVHFDVAAERQPSIPQLHRRILPLDFLNVLLERTVEERQMGRDESARTWLAAALAEISRLERRSETGASAGDGSWRVQTILRRIQENPAERYSISELARSAGWSHQHLIRMFRKVLGRTPVEVITGVKIEAAKAALRHSSEPLKQIARSLGYEDEFYFCRRFRQVVGTTPGRFRDGG